MGEAKILVIDDEQGFLDLMKEKLELDGYAIITADDGEKGMQEVQTQKPDLVICDIRMPKKDGYEVLKELRQNKDVQNTPFIMLTVVDDFDNIKRAYDEKADFYTTKPVEFSKLLKNIQILLNIKSLK